MSERWYSPELMIVVHTRHSDPRTGERIYRLEGLKRGEPAADLFRPPADFEMRPAPAPRAEKREAASLLRSGRAAGYLDSARLGGGPQRTALIPAGPRLSCSAVSASVAVPSEQQA